MIYFNILMRKYFVANGLFLVLLIVLMAGCAENTAPNQDTPAQENVIDNSNKSDRPVGRPGAKFSDESALKYILGSSDYNMWGVLCRLSSRGKEIHDSKYTLICPDNKALLTYGMDIVSLLKKPENKALLDKLVERHVIDHPLTIEKMKSEESLTTIGGEVLTFDTKALTLNGIALNTDQMITKQGIMIGLSGCIDFPIEALKKQMKN